MIPIGPAIARDHQLVLMGKPYIYCWPYWTSNKYLGGPTGSTNDPLLALLGQQQQGIISWPYWASHIFIAGPIGLAINIQVARQGPLCNVQMAFRKYIEENSLLFIAHSHYYKKKRNVVLHYLRFCWADMRPYRQVQQAPTAQTHLIFCGRQYGHECCINAASSTSVIPR